MESDKTRLIHFSGYFLALIVAFIIPELTIIIIGLDALIMAASLFLNVKCD